jgi:hypothetical protein
MGKKRVQQSLLLGERGAAARCFGKPEAGENFRAGVGANNHAKG